LYFTLPQLESTLLYPTLPYCFLLYPTPLPCSTTLFYPTPYNSIKFLFHCVLPCFTLFYCTPQYSILFYCAIPCSTLFYSTPLNSLLLNCTLPCPTLFLTNPTLLYSVPLGPPLLCATPFYPSPAFFYLLFITSLCSFKILLHEGLRVSQ